jgi:hypothetical protein
MFLYTNKAFMTDMGSNFVVHLLLVHMISLFTEFTGTFIFGTISFLFPFIYNCKKHFKITYRRIVKHAFKGTSM